jgi:hypothetical protein
MHFCRHVPFEHLQLVFHPDPGLFASMKLTLTLFSGAGVSKGQNMHLLSNGEHAFRLE